MCKAVQDLYLHMLYSLLSYKLLHFYQISMQALIYNTYRSKCIPSGLLSFLDFHFPNQTLLMELMSTTVGTV